MFIHNFKYSLKTLFRNKSLVFWTLAFPIILGTLFNMAFANIGNSEKLDIIDIAVVKDEEFENNEVFVTAFESLSDENSSERMFNTKYVTEEEAQNLLKDDKVVGYLKIENDNPKVTFITNGLDQTVFKYVVEEIEQTGSIIKNVSENEIKTQMMAGNTDIDYMKIYENAYKMTQEDNTKLKDISNKNLDIFMVEFYTLIAMTCLYGGMLSITAINQSMANISNKGKRVSVSPTQKLKIILSSLSASYVIQLLGLAMLFAYTIKVINVDYGEKAGLVVLLAMVGSLAGLALGTVIGAVLKSNENAKTGILIGVTMLGCYLSGMMGPGMKYVVDSSAPFINKINPASIITDGFYSLYYYNTLDRYFFDLGSLLIFTFVLITVSFFALRGQKYDSI